MKNAKKSKITVKGGLVDLHLYVEPSPGIKNKDDVQAWLKRVGEVINEKLMKAMEEVWMDLIVYGRTTRTVREIVDHVMEDKSGRVKKTAGNHKDPE